MNEDPEPDWSSVVQKLATSPDGDFGALLAAAGLDPRNDLAGADLSGLDLSGVDFSGADLRGSDLSRSKLAGALLRLANVQNADLVETDLRGADLTDANLRGADLTGANLIGCKLQGTDLSDAIKDGVKWGESPIPDFARVLHGPMRAMDVMTTNVISIGPNSSVAALAKLLSEHGISGVPVVDRDNRLVGVVTEGDLQNRAETGTARRTQRRRSRWLDTFVADQEPARDYVKAHGRTVWEIMTRQVISVDETTELADIAILLETKRIKRVPVLRDGKLVGIVSRANLVRALASQPAIEAASDDRTIREKLLAELKGPEWVHAWAADIIVRDRVVHLWFSDDRPEEERQAVRVAAENTPGVRQVEEHIVPVPMFLSF
jgi:CBS domain-containing protein